MDTVEIGFVGGQVNPALFIQDNPLFGLNFTQDVVSYKRQLTLLTTLPKLTWTAEEINRRLDNQLIICVDTRRTVEHF